MTYSGWCLEGGGEHGYPIQGEGGEVSKRAQTEKRGGAGMEGRGEGKRDKKAVPVPGSDSEGGRQRGEMRKEKKKGEGIRQRTRKTYQIRRWRPWRVRSPGRREGSAGADGEGENLRGSLLGRTRNICTKRRHRASFQQKTREEERLQTEGDPRAKTGPRSEYELHLLLLVLHRQDLLRNGRWQLFPGERGARG